MLNAPLEWNVMLHWSKSPPIKSVLMLAKQYEDTLISTWKSSWHFHTRETTQSKHAHHTSADDGPQAEMDSVHSPYEDDPKGAFHYPSDEWNMISKDAFSVQNQP
jgi:hypothetical protein